jgi:redox-sensitive bicupin YhaK (pirin superfamily)
LREDAARTRLDAAHLPEADVDVGDPRAMAEHLDLEVGFPWEHRPTEVAGERAECTGRIGSLLLHRAEKSPQDEAAEGAAALLPPIRDLCSPQSLAHELDGACLLESGRHSTTSWRKLSHMDSLEMVIVPPTRELGDGFQVRRALPTLERRMVGPFVFLDQMGPTLLGVGHGLDVRPHPHIGLATVTYLFEGEILHRDSLGRVQPIRPGEVNWMTAGRGIVHSERTPPHLRPIESNLFGIQTWVALPREREEMDPSFAHHPAASLPVVEGEGKRLRVIAGAMFGARSPVETESEMFYVDAQLEAGAEVAVPAGYEERAVYVAQGEVEIPADGTRFEQGRLLVLKPGQTVALQATAEAARVMLLGGPSLDGPRRVWWNFVSSSTERLDRAKREWSEGLMAKVPGETEFIPLPEYGPAKVRYP